MDNVITGVDWSEDNGEYLKPSIEKANCLSDVSFREDNAVEEGSEGDLEDGSGGGTDGSFGNGSKDYEEGYER